MMMKILTDLPRLAREFIEDGKMLSCAFLFNTTGIVREQFD
jgi:hypothetical protein